MDELFNLAEELRKTLSNPYVGSEHILLAYLKLYPNEVISYEVFRDYIIKVIGRCSKECNYVLYTPIARNLKNNCNSVDEVIDKLLNNQDSIACNLLLSMGIDKSKLLK